jgi:hypothetical protein
MGAHLGDGADTVPYLGLDNLQAHALAEPWVRHGLGADALRDHPADERGGEVGVLELVEHGAVRTGVHEGAAGGVVLDELVAVTPADRSRHEALEELVGVEVVALESLEVRLEVAFHAGDQDDFQNLGLGEVEVERLGDVVPVEGLVGQVRDEHANIAF